MEETKPIKRSKELAPLSREHHDGLLFSWKLKQGLENGTPPEAMCGYVRWYWTNHIKPHFKDEEKVLTSHLPAENPLVQRMVKEHESIRDLVISLDKEPDNNSLRMLAGLIEKHIRFEERELFAYAEETLTPGQLNDIYKALAEEPFCNDDWKNEFWAKK